MFAGARSTCGSVVLPNNGSNVHCPDPRRSPPGDGEYVGCGTRYSKNLGGCHGWLGLVSLKGISKVKSCTRKVSVAVTAVASVAGMVFAATPAAAAGSATFSIDYGASYYKGAATWSNRTVDVTGSFKTDICRRVYVRAFAGSTTLDVKSTSGWC